MIDNILGADKGDARMEEILLKSSDMPTEHLNKSGTKEAQVKSKMIHVADDLAMQLEEIPAMIGANLSNGVVFEPCRMEIDEALV